MPDTLDYQDPNPQEHPTTGVDPNWVRGLNDYLAGRPTDYDPKQGVPPGYKIENGQAVPTNAWDEWGKGAAEFFAPAALGLALPSVSPFGGGSGLSTVGNYAVNQGIKKGSMSLLDDILGSTQGIGQVLGAAARGSQGENATNDYLKLGAAGQKTGALSTALRAPGARLSTALQAALAKTATPAQVHWGGPGSGLRGEIPTFTGGSNSIYQALEDPNVKSLSSRITADELLSQMQGGPSGGNTDANLGLDQVGQESTGDKILGGLALGSNLLGAANKGGLLNRILSTKPPSVEDYGPSYGPPDPYANYGPPDPIGDIFAD